MIDQHEARRMSQIAARRTFLQRTSGGLGAAALLHLLGDPTHAASSAGGALHSPHFPPRAKRIIYLFMSGGPSQMETFDPKPQLAKYHGKQLPESIRMGQRITTMTRGHDIVTAKSLHKFDRYGKCGHEMNVLFRHLSKVADDLCIVRSMFTEPINHDPAVTFVQTGSPVAGRPCIGSWLSYGLGSMNKDLPEFVVLLSGNGQPVLSRYWNNGFLPSRHQGVQFQSQGDPVLYLSNPPGMTHENRGRLVDGISDLNQLRHQQVGDPETEARIDAFQMAYRMQTSVPELMDISQESKHVLDMYGAVPGQASFAANCLLARRLAERGVRCIQLYDRGWDHHGNVTGGVTTKLGQTERSCAALIADLKQRGLLDDTLVVWGGEFGRTSYSQGRLSDTFGRDHHPRCFNVFLAGGGVRAGLNYGETDEFGYNITKDPVHVHDLQATLLHCLGIDHKRLTYRFKGRDFRLTDIHGTIVKPLLA